METTQHPTVVVVNDDPTQLRLSTTCLEKDGWNVFACHGAEEALRVLHTQPQIDVLVIDLHMPQIDGWRLCRLLRSPAYILFNKTPILIMSATFAGADAEEITASLGANAFLSVPYEAGVLRTYVRALSRGETPQATPHVLITTAHTEQAAALQHAFITHGYTVSVAATGTDSQRSFQEQPPDIVILDYNLPDVAGDILLQGYKQQSPSLVAIMTTTEATADLALRFLYIGADAYVRTPFAPEYLLDLCAKARRERALLRIETVLESRTQALRESEQRFRAAKDYAENLINSSLDMIISCDTQRRITEFNSAAERVFGYRKEEVLGQSVDMLYADPSAGLQIHQRVLESGFCGEIHNKNAWGKTFRTYLSAAALRDVNGNVVGVMGVSRDVTQEVALRAQVQQAQKLEAIAQLAGGIAHDFNNLLAIVMGYANLLKLDAQAEDGVFQAAEQIERAAERGAVLTRQLLGFARQGKYQHVSIDLHRTVLDVIMLLSASIHARISITQRFHAPYATVMGDPGQIQQAIMNVAMNACEAMPEGGELIFTTAHVLLEVEECRELMGLTPGAYTRLAVTDTGTGMPPEVLERIFEPFFTTKAFGQGAGMGLAMVDGIIKNHGGAIYVESKVGSGTTFTMYFPRTNGSALFPHTPSPTSSAVSRPRLLVVEGEEIVRAVAVELLERLGYEAVAVADGREAIEYSRLYKDTIDLVIIDMLMLPMSAQECFQALKAIAPRVKALFSAGGDRREIMQEARREGVIGFLQKPYNLQQLASVIQLALAAKL